MGTFPDDYDSDAEIAIDHNQLVEDITKLERTQYIRKPTRNEPTLQKSEFHLVKSEGSKDSAVSYTDLVKVLGKTASHSEIGKKLRSTQKKTKTLSKPLEKPQAERIQRAVVFDNVKKELGKWNAVVTANRVAPHRTFPLNQADISMKPSSAFLSKFRVQSDLEKELELIKPVEEVADDDADTEFPLTLEEMMEHRKEAAKLRAQQSYREAKARRQNKIKSKKYHRIEKRNRIKKKLQELEILQKTNPEAALKQLEELEKTRAGERASLRHSSTGKWAQKLQIRAKNDSESRAELAQQLSIYRDLTQKVKLSDSSESEDEENLDMALESNKGLQNPWTQEKNEIDDFVSGYRKFWNEQNEKCAPDADENVQTSSYKKNSSVQATGVTELSKTLQNKSSIKLAPTLQDKSSIELAPILQNNSSKQEIRKRKQSKLSSNTSKSSAISQKSTDIKRSNLGVASNNKNSKRSASTSSWEVTDVINGGKKKLVASAESCIDDLFENLEESVQDEISRKLNKIRNQVYNENSNTMNHGADSDNDVPDLSFKNNKKKPIIDAELDETTSNKVSDVVNGYSNLKKQYELSSTTNVTTNDAESIDPNKFINLKPKQLLNDISSYEITNDMIDDDDERKNGQMILAEAFEEDDIVTDFQKEKQDAIEKEKPKDIDLFLPGWGSWGGKNIKSKRKRKCFTIRCPKKIPRKDENRGDLIINENPSAKLKTHMVSELPFPFTSIADFEASVRAPIGNTFIPVNASKKLTKPAIETKLGAIIDPMDENMLVKRKKMKGKNKL